MYSGFLGEQKNIKFRAPIEMAERLEAYTNYGSKHAAVARAIIELGLQQADKMHKADFMKLIKNVKDKYLKEKQDG